MTRARALLMASLLTLAAAAALAAPAAADDPGQGVGLQAVVGGSSTGTGSTSGGGSSTGYGSGSGSGDTSGAGAGAAVAPPGAAVAEPVEPVDAATLLDVSGLRTRYHPSFDPAGGRLVVRFVVRNSSHRTIDASARFWATTVVAGHHVGSSPTVAVDAIAPGESRTVSQEIGAVGQWTLVTAHMKLAPVSPAGTDPVDPVLRDRTVVAVPWAMIVLLLVLAAGITSAHLSGRRGRVPTARPVVVA